ncbi:MerR family transcriptional regulator [Knoellia locipacati]|uniref:MerR family transcriptional regulator n=1 Tax=Knoellia locipacati TaxID=882824 RepID=UPI0011BEE509|nr:MerR family transcriptional regulator [Knoellia locipacati]
MTTTRETVTVDELLTVGQVAQTFGVTVRTLHHYDEVGLLRPSERSHAGYRLYTAQDLERLATIVTYRRLDLPLDEVAALLRGDGSTIEHLRRQRAAVMDKVDELRGLVDAIDAAMEREMDEQPATHEDLKQIFGDGFKDEYQAEAQERWGETDAWKQSARRTKGYTKADWERIKTEGDAVNAQFVTALEAGLPATSPEAMDAAEAARMQIHTWFYDCSHDFHRNLGDMYVADPRFTKTFEDIAPGLAQYVRDAIHANADRHA